VLLAAIQCSLVEPRLYAGSVLCAIGHAPQ
jgi:hypothetical protein